MNLGCAILAGGSGFRVGGVNKALIEVDGIPIISRILSVVSPLFSDIVIVSGDHQAFSSLTNVDFISDDITGVGPLGGIYSALKRTSCDALLILACDMPYLSRSFLERQCDTFRQKPCDVLVPRYVSVDASRKDRSHIQMIEPLHSIYHRRLSSKMKDYLTHADIYSVRDFLFSTDACFFETPGDPDHLLMFTNLNTTEDIKRSSASL
ncbi:molybdenum cofactor guanylyltransferase [Bacteroidota bacterium]